MNLLNKQILNLFYIFLGVLCATIGLKGFLLPNGFFDGGITGVSLLLNHFINTDLAILIFILNLPFVYFGNMLISREFAIKSTFSILLLALALHLIQLPTFTNDKLLISLFGGVFLGAGIGLCMRGGSVIDGTEILAVQVSRKSSLTVGDFIALFNVVLFSIVATFINLETAMYSILTYVAASKSVDFIISGIEEYVGVTIVSPQFRQIHNHLVNELRRGVTIYKTEGGYGQDTNTEERKAIFCVVTRLEVTSLIANIQAIDPKAFLIQHSIKDTHGGMIKKRPLH